MKHSDDTAALSEALSKAQAVMAGAKNDAANPFFKSKYADLASCWEACKGALTGNGIAVVQGNTPHDGGVQVQTRLTHKSGQWIEDDGLFVPATKADAQGFGSALTYARRYSLCAMVGIAPEDDDGNAAAKTAPAKLPEENNFSADQKAARLKAAAIANHDSIMAIKEGIRDGKLHKAAEAWYELDDQTKADLWVAPTKFTDAPFTTQERDTMKSPAFRIAGNGGAA